jgi:cell division septal protein FtsQ
MWTRRKAKNRRFERAHVLDVKLRSHQARTTRLRAVSSILGISLGTVLGLFILWQGLRLALDLMVYENNAFSIRAISIRTDGDIPVEEIRQWAGVKFGENLLALDLSRVRRDLELVPWIQEATVERVLPDSLRLSITEREPISQAYAWQPRPGYPPSVFYLDAAAFVMSPRKRQPDNSSANTLGESLPLLTGIPASELKPGRQVLSDQVRAALRLIEEFAQSPMLGVVDIQQIDLSTPDLLRMTTRQSNEVTFATHRLETQLRRWRAIYDVGLKRGKSIATLDLSVSNHIPATWFEANFISVPKPKTHQPTRNRKKHV